MALRTYATRAPSIDEAVEEPALAGAIEVEPEQIAALGLGIVVVALDGALPPAAADAVRAEEAEELAVLGAEVGVLLVAAERLGLREDLADQRRIALGHLGLGQAHVVGRLEAEARLGQVRRLELGVGDRVVAVRGAQARERTGGGLQIALGLGGEERELIGLRAHAVGAQDDPVDGALERDAGEPETC